MHNPLACHSESANQPATQRRGYDREQSPPVILPLGENFSSIIAGGCDTGSFAPLTMTNRVFVFRLDEGSSGVTACRHFTGCLAALSLKECLGFPSD